MSCMHDCTIEIEAENDLYVTAENFPESGTKHKLVLNDIPIMLHLEILDAIREKKR